MHGLPIAEFAVGVLVKIITTAAADWEAFRTLTRSNPDTCQLPATSGEGPVRLALVFQRGHMGRLALPKYPRATVAAMDALPSAKSSYPKPYRTALSIVGATRIRRFSENQCDWMRMIAFS
jgi:hypothetical protein